MRHSHFCLPFLLCTLLIRQGLGQCPYLPPNEVGYWGDKKEIVRLDPITGFADTASPFDRWFLVRRYYKANSPLPRSVFVTPRVQFAATGAPISPTDTTPVCFSVTKSDITDEYPDYTSAIDIVVPPRDPGSSYDIVFGYSMPFDMRERITDAFLAYHNHDTTAVQETIKAIDADKVAHRDYLRFSLSDFKDYYVSYVKAMIDAATDRSSVRATLIAQLDNGGQPLASRFVPGATKQLFINMEILSVVGTDAFKLETRVNARLQPDFGVALYGIGGRSEVGINKDFVGAAPYVGVSVLFRSFDGDIPVQYIRKRLSPYQRLSLHAGVTLFSLAKDSYRQNLFNTNNLMLGLGYRINSVSKIQGGVLLYRKTDPNPLYTTSTIAPIGYVALSLDLRVRNVLADIGKFLFGAN